MQVQVHFGQTHRESRVLTLREDEDMILPALYWFLVSARTSRAILHGVCRVTEPLREPVTWFPVISNCTRLSLLQTAVTEEVRSEGDTRAVQVDLS